MAKDIHSTHHFVGGAGISGLPQAAAAGEPVTYEQMQAALEGIAWKDDVVAASGVNINLAAPGAAIDGVAMTAGARFLALAQTTPAENGVYIWNGAAAAATRAPDMSASAEFNSAVVPVKPGGATNGGTTWRCGTADPTVGTTAIVLTAFVAAAPAATESTAGVAEVATQAEADAGADDGRMVTPQKLANWSGRKRKAGGTVGDGSATQFTINHNFATRDVTVEVYRNSGAYDSILCDVDRPSANAVRLTFASAPAANAFAYVILG